MKLILNDIKYLSLKDIKFYNGRLYYHIEQFKMYGLFIRINKNMIEKYDKYKIYLTDDIIQLNDYISMKYKSFIKDINKPNIEVIKNEKTEKIYNDNQKYLVLNFMSINDNNYPKIHILPWQENQVENR